jgi:hypothetical protein
MSFLLFKYYHHYKVHITKIKRYDRVQLFYYLLSWHYTVTTLRLKQLPNNKTVMDTNHCVQYKIVYGHLAIRPDTEK